MKIKQTVAAGALASMIAVPAFAELDSGASQASMTVPIFAAITQLDNFVLTNNRGVDGAANAGYGGTETFHLESNAQVRLTLASEDLTNGEDTISSQYVFGNGQATLDTQADSVHNDIVVLQATGELGEISDQKAGDYAANLVITVSAL